jgi:hypothetical protein
MLARRQLAARITAVALVAFAAGFAPALTVGAEQAWAGTLDLTACSGFGDDGNDTDITARV